MKCKLYYSTCQLFETDCQKLIKMIHNPWAWHNFWTTSKKTAILKRSIRTFTTGYFP
ncbi:hypothetical protein YC2023_041932 [Brassica napus]